MTTQKNKESKTETTTEKTCFVIMPIADMDGYEKGHFSRVYEHVIKPSCQKAGLTPIRADEVSNTNHIVLDILKKILECDMAICDISGRNPNVLYELGVRQAFNKPVTIIKDNVTDDIFDIQGLRYVEYSDSLRIDHVKPVIDKISESLTTTYQDDGKSINSVIQLLGIDAAEPPGQITLSEETSLILSSLDSISNRMTDLEQNTRRDNTLTFEAVNKLINSTSHSGKPSFQSLADLYSNDSSQPGLQGLSGLEIYDHKKNK